MDNARNLVNQMRFNRTKQEDELPPVYKKDFTNISPTTAVYDAMQHLVSEGATILHDVNVIRGNKIYPSTTIEVWYGCHEIMEDPHDGSPITPEQL